MESTGRDAKSQYLYPVGGSYAFPASYPSALKRQTMTCVLAGWAVLSSGIALVKRGNSFVLTSGLLFSESCFALHSMVVQGLLIGREIWTVGEA